VEDELIIREKKILAILEREIMDGEEMAAAVGKMAEQMLLDEKGFAPAEVRRNVDFTVVLGEERVRSHMDLLVTLDGRNAMIIKCAPGSIDSRQRQAVAAARVMGELPVPVAVVMDPRSAVALDSATGKVIGEGFEAIPSREELVRLLAGRELKPVPPEKAEREKRILLAFDAIRCCIPQGAGGGVSLKEDDKS